VGVEAEDGRALRRAVAAEALEDGRAVVDDVGADVDAGVVPRDEFPLIQMKSERGEPCRTISRRTPSVNEAAE
jgi:hypothetical protein